MNRTVVNPVVNPKIREYARQLLRHESVAYNPSEPGVPAAARVFETLRRTLGTLVGVNGFRVLLARALKLASTEIPDLGSLRVKADGTFDGLSENSGIGDPEAGVALLAHVLGLLAVFIGEDLMLRILLDPWPNSALFNLPPSGDRKDDSRQ